MGPIISAEFAVNILNLGDSGGLLRDLNSDTRSMMQRLNNVTPFLSLKRIYGCSATIGNSGFEKFFREQISTVLSRKIQRKWEI